MLFNRPWEYAGSDGAGWLTGHACVGQEQHFDGLGGVELVVVVKEALGVSDLCEVRG